VLTTITKDALTADFKVVPYVTAPDAPVHTRASFAVEDRVRGLHKTYDRPLDAGPTARPQFGDLDRSTVAAETDRP